MSEVSPERVAGIEARLASNEALTKAQEARIVKLEQVQAVDAERYKHIDGKLDKIETTMTWVVRLVFAVLVGGLLNFMLSGGMNVPGAG